MLTLALQIHQQTSVLWVRVRGQSLHAFSTGDQSPIKSVQQEKSELKHCCHTRERADWITQQVRIKMCLRSKIFDRVDPIYVVNLLHLHRRTFLSQLVWIFPSLCRLDFHLVSIGIITEF
jgi:hypothetical protein